MPGRRNTCYASTRIGEVAFSVVGDIAKHAAKEHGYLACQVDAEEETP